MKAKLIASVKNFLLEGQLSDDIKEFLFSQDVNPGEVAEYLKAAWDSIISEVDIPPDKLKSMITAKLFDLARVTRATGDYAGAKSCLKEIITLHDLKKVDNHTEGKRRSTQPLKNVTWPTFQKTKNSQRK